MITGDMTAHLGQFDGYTDVGGGGHMVLDLWEGHDLKLMNPEVECQDKIMQETLTLQTAIDYCPMPRDLYFKLGVMEIDEGTET